VFVCSALQGVTAECSCVVCSGLQGMTVVCVKCTVFCDVTPYPPSKLTEISKQLTASIFRDSIQLCDRWHVHMVQRCIRRFP
jgi:hypothetical protein